MQNRLDIPDFLQAACGRALCMYSNVEWGDLVRQGKYHDEHFADELVEACAELVREWKPTPAPSWVTAIPSRRRPDLVLSFAKRLAKALRLQFRDVLERTEDSPQQKDLENDYLQAKNAFKSLGAGTALPADPLLLVDDIVDSRWSMTAAAYKLRFNGSGRVFPLALSLLYGTDA